MNRLRNRLILIFAAATLVPLAASFWVAHSLMDRSLRYSAVNDLDKVSQSLEQTARQFYQRERQILQDDVAHGRAGEPEAYGATPRAGWPESVRAFADSDAADRFVLGGRDGDVLYYLVRRDKQVLQYARPLGGIQMEAIRREYARTRAVVEDLKARDLRRGLFFAFVLLAAVPWLAALVIVVVAAHRISAVATEAYSRMAQELQKSRERLLFLTRLESWQSLARKTAHEVKNSLTPIRLMMEELAARHRDDQDSFERQAAQVIVDEVTGLERRVRAFSEFAAEPPVRLKPLNAAELLEERIVFLRAAHPQVSYRFQPPARPLEVLADEDLLKAVLTNLLENAAQAAGPGGEILAMTSEAADGGVAIEVHDSGPGLSSQAIESLFEPTISFKKGGMGLGLSIARKSAVLCGGDIVLVKGELGGAGFRVLLSPAA